jgi:lycopene beta-cyclase
MSTSPPVEGRFDYALVGGGLQNALLALALLAKRPRPRVVLVERDAAIGGNHLWSFHAGDVPEDARPLIEPLIVARWPGYGVAYPSYQRRLASAYASVSSTRLDRVVKNQLAGASGSRLLAGSAAVDVGEHAVEMSDGSVIEADVVVDARGPALFRPAGPVSYQKFLGLELNLRDDAPAEPLLMDARVEQSDGYRFFYVLPLSTRKVLIEDTYYSDDPRLDEPVLRREILAYAAENGMTVQAIEREETGVLPLPLSAPAKLELLDKGPLIAGYRGGWFHPTTGYSFPAALRLALWVAARPKEQVFGPALRSLAAEHLRQVRFATLLNRLLFDAFPPERRWHALERFYRLPETTIRRFYALTTTSTDRARIICGRPPSGLSLGTLLQRRHRTGASS